MTTGSPPAATAAASAQVAAAPAASALAPAASASAPSGRPGGRPDSCGPRAARGLRELKKERTHDALVQAAAELFTAHDYDDVTVARIAEVAGVSTRTFFSYFPSKEDVLFADTHTRLEQALQSMADRVPGESPVDLLVRAVRRALPASFSPGPGPEVSGSALPSLYGVRLRLNHSTPQIQAGAMRRLQEAQQLLSRALLAAFPERLTAVEAAALVGAFIGGISNAVIFCLAEDPDLPDTSQVAFEALEVVRRRLPELDRGAEG